MATTINNDSNLLELSDGVFYWNTDYEHANNETTLCEFLDIYLPSNCEVVLFDGTYAEVSQNGNLIGIHASGNGDFHHHKVQFESIVEEK